MTTSTHKAEVVFINKIESIPEADQIGVVEVWGYPCVVRYDDFNSNTQKLWVYCPPDSMVPVDRKEFKFLDKGRDYERITVRKYKKQRSFGLLVKAPSGAKEGDDYAKKWKIEHYEPRVKRPTPPKGGFKGKWLHKINRLSRRFGEKPPKKIAPYYDIEALRRYPNLFTAEDDVVVTEKLHGCVKYNTRVRMADGYSKQIYTISPGEFVLGMDSSGHVVPSKVIKTFNNGPSPNGWFNIKYKHAKGNRGGNIRSITITPNHPIYLPKEGKYIQAVSLKKGDIILSHRGNPSLTPAQIQILLGKILGDGSLSIREDYEASAITWGHKEQQYTNDIVSSLTGLGKTTGTYISGYGTTIYRASTTYNKNIHQLFTRNFYRKSKGKIGSKDLYKGIYRKSKGEIGSKDLYKGKDILLSQAGPLTLAIWYMDDGSLGSHSGQEGRANFAVCRYTQKDCKVLLRLLKKFGMVGVLYKANDYLRIRLNADEAEKLFLIIAPYIPKYMQYKLPERYRNGSGWLPYGPSVYKPELLEQEILEISRVQVRGNRYNIETETNNYFASDMLVHNSNVCWLWEDRGKLFKLKHWLGHLRWKNKPVLKEHARYLWARSRHVWKRPYDNPWFDTCPEGVIRLLQKHPDWIVFGEIIGPGVQNLDYGLSKPEARVFDILTPDGWMPYDEFEARANYYSIPTVPWLYTGKYDFEKIEKLADGKTTVEGAKHIREGVVVKCANEEKHPRFGRKQLKLVGFKYLEKEGKLK